LYPEQLLPCFTGKKYLVGIWQFWVFNGIINTIHKDCFETKLLRMFNNKTAPLGVKLKTGSDLGSPSARDGFTLIELLVVMTIMVLFAGALSINLGGQRASRDIKIAQNQLVTNIRKAQSYTLSSRILPSGQSAQYYILKFDLSSSTQYSIQAISGASSQPQLQDVEIVNLPPNIEIGALTPSANAISVSRSVNPATQPMYTNCALAVFAAPFGKIIFNDGCDPSGSSFTPANLGTTTDYYAKIINFQSNVACDGNNGNPANPAACTASTDSIMVITLVDRARTVSKKVLINAITGLVCPTQDGATCSAS
jgi:prepilin-type N-terminal cleavage/methylation domain-containing protein